MKAASVSRNAKICVYLLAVALPLVKVGADTISYDKALLIPITAVILESI